jgi:hypothetical protein
MISPQAFLDFRQGFPQSSSPRLGLLEPTEDFDGPEIEH